MSARTSPSWWCDGCAAHHVDDCPVGWPTRQLEADAANVDPVDGGRYGAEYPMLWPPPRLTERTITCER